MASVLYNFGRQNVARGNIAGAIPDWMVETRARTFASLGNTQPVEARWTDSISHGELIRDGFDEHLEIDPEHLQFLFQGVSDNDRTGKGYGEIPWKLGLLEKETARE